MTLETGPSDQDTGYLHPGYAESLAEFGSPRHLPRSGGSILVREIPGTDLLDAMGPYPLLACRDWRALSEDLAELEDEIVCVGAVPDPFGAYTVDELRACFPDVCVPFKERYVIDLSQPLDSFVTRRHRKSTRRAMQDVTVEEHPKPIEFLDEWVELHSNLVERHGITGIRAFSRESFAKQLVLPGSRLLVASHDGQTLGAQLWLVHGGVAFGHVLAFNALGYKLGAPYALYWFALERLAPDVGWCDIGGVAGVEDEGSEGLHRFKRGWTTLTRTAHFCGRVFNRAAYDEATRRAGKEGVRYFPAYRQGEMG